MRIDDLDNRMRAFETAPDPCVLPGVFPVARLDGRDFTRPTKDVHRFEKPSDRRFHDLMRQAAEHLMTNCGLAVTYAISQSDEISLLFGPDSDGFGRKLRKLPSILSGEASARFSPSELLVSGAAYAHPEGRKAVFVGDLVDRGPRTLDTVRLVAPQRPWR